MAHHFVPTLIHTQVAHPGLTAGQAHYISPLSTDNSLDEDVPFDEDFLACRRRVQRGLLCFSIFVLQLIIVINVKDTVVLCRIFVGLSSALILIQLIRCSMSIFCARSRHPLPPDSFLRANYGHSRVYVRRGQSQPLPQQMTASGVAAITIANPVNPTSRSQSVRDDPPPYCVALSFPQPSENESSGVPLAETPPPPYEKLLPSIV